MGSCGIVREVFKSFRFKSWWIVLHTDYFPDSWHVIVEESKTPDMMVVESSLPKNVDNFVIERFIFQHPENRFRCEDISIENIFSFYELYDFFLISWPHDITKWFQFVDGVIFFDNYVWSWLAFWYYGWSSAGIAWVYWIVSLLWSVELSCELSRSECIESDVTYLSVFVTTQWNGSFGDINQYLEFERSSWSVSDNSLADIRFADHKFFNFSLDVHSIFENILVLRIKEALIHLNSKFIDIILLFYFFHIQQHGRSCYQFVVLSWVRKIIICWAFTWNEAGCKDEIDRSVESREFFWKEICGFTW